jgi:hypothetical protein
MFFQLLTVAFFLFGLGESWARRHHPCSPGFHTQLRWAIFGMYVLYGGGFFDEMLASFWLASKFLEFVQP